MKKKINFAVVMHTKKRKNVYDRIITIKKKEKPAECRAKNELVTSK